MQAPFWYHFWFHFGVHFGAVLGAKWATILILGPLGLFFCSLLLHPISLHVLMNFGCNCGGWGEDSTGRENIPRHVFLDISP